MTLCTSRAPLGLTLLLVGCGGFPGYDSVPPAASIRPSAAGEDAAVEELARRFYATSVDLDALEGEIRAAVEGGGDSATLHEMAAHLAELREDDAAAWEHWLRAAADRSSPFGSIYLQRALSPNLTASQMTASIQTLRALIEDHPRSEVRLEARRQLIRLYERRERLDEARRIGDDVDTIRQWQLIGPFDNDQGRGFFAVYPPEQDADLTTEHRGLRLPVRWRPVTTIDRGGRVHIDGHVSPSQWALAYLNTFVHSGAAREVELRLTTPTGVRVWLNGGLVVDQERLADEASDNIVVAVRLEAGWNRLFVKSVHGDTGGWTFGARFTEPGGAPITGLRTDAAPHETPDRPREEPPESESPLIDALALVEPPLRRTLLTHHDAVRNGFQSDALETARSLLEQASEHPVVLYHAAITHWRNDELGRAMDLLNAGVERFPDHAGFLWQRGAFYRERDRYDRAFEDLERTRALQPRARLATMELAGTFADRGWREHEQRVLEEAVERWPDSGWALRALGLSLQQRGYLDRAHDRYRAAAALEPGQSWNLAQLANHARFRGDHDEAVQLAARSRRISPWSSNAALSEADFLRYADRRAEARERYLELTERDPGWTSPHYRLGTMAYEEGDGAGAVEAWSAALTRNPEDGPLADRIDFLRDPADDPDRRLMPSEAEIEGVLAASADFAVDPGAHTVILLDDEVTTVQRDGSSMRRITQVHLAVTTDGRDALIRTQVPANARVLQAYSVTPQGRRQEASSIRGGTIRFRGLEVGSRVVMQYVFHAQPPAFLPNHFVSTWLFQGSHRQLGLARWVVQVPSGRELALHVQGPVQHTVRQEGEHDYHIFSAAGVPPLVPEPQMPPSRDLLATVVLSTLTDWGEYVEWERALLSEVFESNPELRALAVRLTEGADTPQARLERIYRFVSQEIRYQQDYENTIAGVRPHSCPVVLERGYGDCKDKAVLMILLGREVDLDIRFAILRTTPAGRVLRGVPNQQFNHAIVYVPPQAGIEGGFMDPTTDGLDMGNLRLDDQGATALVLDPSSGGFEFFDIPYQDAALDYFDCDVSVQLRGAEDAQANADCRARGRVGSVLRRVMRNEERAAQLRQNVAHSFFPGSSVTRSSEAHIEDIDHPVELTMALDASPALQSQSDGHHMRVPTPAFDLGRLTRLETRRTPLRLGPPQSSRWQITFEAPARGRITRTPEDFELEHACFSLTRRTTTRGRRATVEVAYRRTCAEVAPEDYPELRRLAQRAQNQLQDDVIFDL